MRLTARIILSMVLVIGVAAAAILIQRGANRAPLRRLNVGHITVSYDGAESLAVIVEIRVPDQSPAPWAYAQLGDSGGMLNLPQPFPPGAEAILHLGLDADIVELAAGAKARTVQEAKLRGITGAMSNSPLALENAKDQSITALPAAGPPVVLSVHARNGRIVIGG